MKHLSPIFFVAAWFSAAFFSVSANSETLRLATSNFKGNSVKELLLAYRESGYDIVYSDGFVSDTMIVDENPESGEPIHRLKVVLEPFKLTLDVDAKTFYVVRMPEPIERDLKPDSDKPSIQEIVVTASTYKNLGRHFSRADVSVDNFDIDLLPTRANDPVQIMNTLPGVASSGVSSKPYIRGGNDDELLILLDGVELIEPFHLKDFQSLISGIDNQLVDSIDIYSGGFPVKYGGKMGGVMDIQTKGFRWSDKNVLDVNVFATSAKFVGATRTGDASWTLLVRRGNIDDALSYVNPNIGAPRFSDAYGNLRWSTDDKTDLNIGYFNLRDDIKLTSLDEEGTGEEAMSTYNSEYYWLKSTTTHSEDAYSDIILSVVSIKNNRSGFINEIDNPDESVGEITDRRKFNWVRLDLSHSQEVNDQNLFQVGARAAYGRGEYHYAGQATLGEVATLLGTPREIDRQIDLKPEGWFGHFFASHKYSPVESFWMEGGIRVDTQSYNSDAALQFSPRLATRYQVTDRLAVKASIGRFDQEPGLTEINVAEGETEFPKIQKSDHYILGLKYDYSDFININAEAFAKNVFSPRARYQNVFNPYQLLPEISPDRITVQSEKSQVFGYDVFMTYEPSSDFKTWLMYSQIQVEDIVNGARQYRPWNQRHSVRTGFAYQRSAWTLSSSISWHSGWRTTDFPTYVPDLDTAQPYTLNNKKLPTYFALDVKASYQWSRKDLDFEAYMEVTNATNRRNVGYYEAEVTANESIGGYDITYEKENLFRALPSIGITYRF